MALIPAFLQRVKAALAAIGVDGPKAPKSSGKSPKEDAAMDELKAMIDAVKRQIADLKTVVDGVVTELAAVKTATAAEIAALKETIEGLADDAKAVDTVSEKLLERVEALEGAMGAPKGAGDDPPARPAPKPKELVAHVVRPAEFQRR